MCRVWIVSVPLGCFFDTLTSPSRVTFRDCMKQLLEVGIVCSYFNLSVTKSHTRKAL
jgi:hypothetical protein